TTLTSRTFQPAPAVSAMRAACRCRFVGAAATVSPGSCSIVIDSSSLAAGCGHGWGGIRFDAAPPGQNYSVAALTSAAIFSQRATGSPPSPLMMAASVTPQNCHTAPISGMDGIGTALVPTSPKPAVMGSD